MAFYETTFIIRQDVTSTDVDRITEDLCKIIIDQNGQVHKQEYWKLRNLAYEIRKNKKGHYVMLGIEISHSGLNEFIRKIKLNDDILRHTIINVDKISPDPSPILQSKFVENEVTVDVTTRS